jgi:hypothetical protein
MAHREMQRDPATQRMPEDESGREREARDDARDVVGELRDRRIGRPERRRQREAREVDDVDRQSEAAECPDLRRECAPVG